MKKQRPCAKGLGFSLIEIMVAIVLLGLMGVLLMSSINSSIRAKENIEEISHRHQIIRQALNRMAREIAMAYLSKNFSPINPSYITQFVGKKNSLYFSAFGNVVRQKDAKISDQQELGFYLGKDRLGQQSLLRRYDAPLSMDVQRGGKVQVLCPNVSKLEFSYFNDRRKKWEQEWLVTLDSSQGQKSDNNGQKSLRPGRTRSVLPGFVKISMTVILDDKSEQTFITQTKIAMKEPIDFN